mmetsp:Transcript_78384/g.201850  ORF Transcript_78384/g.201850 Transcript_78384/m.201850 type:complete len:237 (-) Transcript_78384:768-1478(-)
MGSMMSTVLESTSLYLPSTLSVKSATSVAMQEFGVRVDTPDCGETSHISERGSSCCMGRSISHRSLPARSQSMVAVGLNSSLRLPVISACGSANETSSCASEMVLKPSRGICNAWSQSRGDSSPRRPTISWTAKSIVHFSPSSWLTSSVGSSCSAGTSGISQATARDGSAKQQEYLSCRCSMGSRISSVVECAVPLHHGVGSTKSLVTSSSWTCRSMSQRGTMPASLSSPNQTSAW